MFAVVDERERIGSRTGCLGTATNEV